MKSILDIMNLLFNVKATNIKILSERFLKIPGTSTEVYIKNM